MKEKRKNNITIGVFLILIFVFSILSFIKPSTAFSETENRFLSQKPIVSIKGIVDGSFGQSYDIYLSDQFPFRNQWIGLKTLAERGMLKQDINGVYFGSDGYLLEKFEAQQIEGELLDKNNERMKTFVNNYQQQLGEDRVKVMLIPSASQIISEKLPPFAVPYNQSKLWSGLQQELGKQTVLPVDEKLKEHKDKPIYYRTDHHWTTLGAYYGYQIWAESMGIVPWDLDRFETDTVTEDFLGTIASKVNVPIKPDSIIVYNPKSPTNYWVDYDMGQKTEDEMYEFSALEGRDKYMVFLDGNHGLTQINSDVKNGKKLLIIKDSFANSFAPFAVNHFESAYLVDLRYMNLNISELIHEKGITDILFLYQAVNFAKDVQLTKLNR